jgi:cobalt/nickel transport system permease protein
MSAIESALAHVGALDALAARDTPAARLDPRVKALATVAFVVVVASFGRGDALRLVPLAAWPLALGALGDVPWRPVLLRIALASPFALGVAAFEPLLDRAPALAAGGVVVSSGAVAFVTVVLKFSLALSAALVLVATTGFDAVCAALERLRVPRLLVAQLLLLYRYLHVLAEEAARLWRAHALRSPDRPRPTARAAAMLLGQLLVRTLARAERLHAAMRCRGFEGALHLVRPTRLSRADLVFAAATVLLLVGCRLLQLTALLSNLLACAR